MKPVAVVRTNQQQNAAYPVPHPRTFLKVKDPKKTNIMLKINGKSPLIPIARKLIKVQLNLVTNLALPSILVLQQTPVARCIQMPHLTQFRIVQMILIVLQSS